MSLATIEAKFVSVMELIGRDFAKGLTFAVKYVVPVAALASMLFPAATAPIASVVNATELIQNAVVVVEQKYAASGVATGTGAQKSAEVLLLAENSVTTLLTSAGVPNVTTAYIQNLVNAVVAILNVQMAPTGA